MTKNEVNTMPAWLKDAIFYEIYPQSFYDSNGDGIGDINGITQKLDYVKSLGFNAIWLNPCFLSPFMDAGYDVADYKAVAPRYGTNEDLYNLFSEAHKRGMHVILDLVPGHTSDEHDWFVNSKTAEGSEHNDTYIWTKSVWDRPQGFSWVAGMAERDGSYLINFFNSQPALNYGFADVTDPSWQMPYTHPICQANFDRMLDVMRFWLDRGCDGFRVDMADSLVKNDRGKRATASLWHKARRMLDKDYPEAVLVSEWCNANRAINLAGFHCDFVLCHPGTINQLGFRNKVDGENKSYFCKTAHQSAEHMLERYLNDYQVSKGNGYMSIISGNHDNERISWTLDESELRLAYTFIFTMPGVPFMYYGDEIGMKYLPQKSKEGGYHRTGSRTPMQWDKNAINLGFSTADVLELYLDVDRSENAPTVSEQIDDPDSLLNFVRSLTQLRHDNEDLQADAEFEVLVCDLSGVLCYRRGNLAVAINPTAVTQMMHMNIGEKIFEVGFATNQGHIALLEPQTAVVFKLK